MCGDPVVRTYDGAYLMVTKPQNSLLTQWNIKRRDPCKIQIRCVTMDDYFGDQLDAPVWVDWCGINFWPHKEQKQYFRNWLFGQNLDVFGERGQGSNGVIKGIHSIFPDTHTFPGASEEFDNLGHPDYWHKDVLRPECNAHPYEAWIDDVNEVISFRSHKDCCGWAVDFYPRGRDTCINIYAENGNPTIEDFKANTKRTDGLCGNMDGDIKNDWRECFTRTPVTPNDPASMGLIADSCVDGKHQGQFYEGGTKLDWASADAGFPQVH